MSARSVASPSTRLGRETGWNSGPVQPLASSSRCRCHTASPFSACTVTTAPSLAASRMIS